MKNLLALILLFSSPFLWAAAPKADLWLYWNVSNEANHETISHKEWQDILDNYLVTQGENTLFKYSAVSEPDKVKLSQYLQKLSKIDPRKLNKREQYAYWVNLYNSLTVQLILDNYPVSSITKLGGWLNFGPWDEKIIRIAQQEITLNDIEHRILRPIWKDPRTHYAVNCASLGCPNLQRQAYTSENTETLLDKAALQFIDSNKGVRYEDGELVLSSIFRWFVEDFGNDEQQLIEYLSPYRPALKNYNGNISYEYNWQLNE